MKRLLFALFLGAFLLLACTPPPLEQGAVQGSAAVQIPQEIRIAIGIGVAALVTAGITFVFRRFGIDLRGQATTIAGAISLWIVTELQNIINVIPEQYDPWTNFVFYALLYVFGTAGTLYLINKGKDQAGDPARLL